MINLELVTVQNSFVKPHFIPELGEEGLTSQEIADSIKMEKRHLHTLIERLLQDGDLVGIPKLGNRINPTNGVPIMDYALTVEDAKFVVTQSSTKAGRSYCKWLITLEKKVESLSAQVKTPTKLELAKLYFEAIQREEHQLKALETSQRNNAAKTHEIKKLRLNLQGKNEFMSIQQYMVTIGIKSKKNTNNLVKLLKENGHDSYELRILGTQEYPTTCFKIEFLEEQTEFIKRYFL